MLPTAQADRSQAQRSVGALRFRKGNPADIAHCLPLLPAGFCANDEVRQSLPRLWARLIEGEAHSFAIIEDLERPYPERIEAFGLSVFVPDRLMSAFEAAPRPQAAAFIYERVLAGEHVVLSADELAAANASDGINVFVLYLGLRNEDLSHPRSAQALNASGAAFYFLHAGYRIKAIVNEVFGAQAAGFVARSGARLLRDFQKERPEAFAGVAAERYPYLFMTRREWINPGAMNLLSQLFHCPPPRVGFSRAEQRVLEYALLNEPDAAIADFLGISQDAVKKTWRNIFARVNRHAPYLIPPDSSGWSGSRGREKRHHLLHYLRAHLEELRPVSHRACVRDAPGQVKAG